MMVVVRMGRFLKWILKVEDNVKDKVIYVVDYSCGY